MPPPPGLAPWPTTTSMASAGEVVRIHAVARRQDLVDEDAGMGAFLGGHAAVAGRRRGADRTGAASQRFLRLRRQRPEAHARNGDRDLQRDRLLGEARPDGHFGRALLAIAFERIAADGSAEEQEIVEMRELALGPEPANVVDA